MTLTQLGSVLALRLVVKEKAKWLSVRTMDDAEVSLVERQNIPASVALGEDRE